MSLLFVILIFQYCDTFVIRNSLHLNSFSSTNRFRDREVYHYFQQEDSYVSETSILNNTSTTANPITSKSNSLTILSPMSPVEYNRIAVVKIIEEAWQKVIKLINPTTLALCESDLKTSTSMLVLATIKRVADENPIVKQTTDDMIREADVNNDGQLTFIEWQNWLKTGTSNINHKNKKRRVTKKDSHGTIDGISSVSTLISNKLSKVLGHAIYTLQITSRYSNNNEDPSILTASFISGGILSGYIDSTLSKTLLTRLPTHIRYFFSFFLLYSLNLALELI